MSKAFQFVTIAALMAMRTNTFNLPHLRYGGRSYNDIPNKHKKHKRGRPK